jgi:co-chaperonin GroES (HSP10)
VSTIVLEIERPKIVPGTLPEPVGYRLLVHPAKIAQKTAGGIVMVDETLELGRHVQFVAEVLAVGPDCYAHPKFMGAEPWCKVGDWVLVRQYSGMSFKLKDADGMPIDIRVLNDDEVLARASTPEALVM